MRGCVWHTLVDLGLRSIPIGIEAIVRLVNLEDIEDDIPIRGLHHSTVSDPLA